MFFDRKRGLSVAKGSWRKRRERLFYLARHYLETGFTVKPHQCEGFIVVERCSGRMGFLRLAPSNDEKYLAGLLAAVGTLFTTRSVIAGKSGRQARRLLCKKPKTNVQTAGSTCHL